MADRLVRQDKLSLEDVTASRTLTEYEVGFLAGMRAFAWMKDGVYYVGATGGMTLRQAERKKLEEWDAAPKLDSPPNGGSR